MLDGGYVDLARPFDTIVSASVVGPFVDVIRGTLAPILRKLELQHLEVGSAVQHGRSPITADLSGAF